MLQIDSPLTMMLVMATISQVILSSILGGVVSLVGGVMLISHKKGAVALARYATPFAGGALLAAVFLDLLKEGINHNGSADTVLIAAIAGIIAFFFAEGFLRWFHHHHEHDKNEDPRTLLVILGDMLHNILDGVAIGAAFLISPATGFVTTIAVAAHEIPQEIGDFGLLLSKGMSRTKVLTVNLTTAVATVIAAVGVFILGDQGDLPIGVLLGLSAGFLLYIAMSDIIPAIHAKRETPQQFKMQALLLVLGVMVVGSAINLAHQYVDYSHTHNEKGEHSHVETYEHKNNHDEDDHQ